MSRSFQSGFKMKKISSGEQLLTYSKGIFLLLAVFFLGCNSDDAPPSVPNPDPETAVSGSSGNREISQVLQEGAIWKSICIPTKTGTEIQQWSFTKIDFLVEFIRYTDNACTNKDYGESVSFSGTYEISSNATPSPEGYQAREIDITFPDEVTLLSLVALSDDESKILMPDFGETRADSFSEAIEYAKSENETTAATSKNLEGEWHSTCAEIGKGKSMGIVLDVKGKQFSWHQFGFTDAQCEEQESKRAREQESKRAREQESKRAKADFLELWFLGSNLPLIKGLPLESWILTMIMAMQKGVLMQWIRPTVDVMY